MVISNASPREARSFVKGWEEAGESGAALNALLTLPESESSREVVDPCVLLSSSASAL